MLTCTGKKKIPSHMNKAKKLVRMNNCYVIIHYPPIIAQKIIEAFLCLVVQ